MPVIIKVLEEITDELVEGLTDEECEQFSAISDKILCNAISAVEDLRNEK